VWYQDIFKEYSTPQDEKWKVAGQKKCALRRIFVGTDKFVANLN